MATWMCCRCSDASWELYAVAALTWATRANAQQTALSIRQHLFIDLEWRRGGTQAAWSVGQGGQVPEKKSGWVLLTQDRMAPADGFGWMHEDVMSSPLWSLSAVTDSDTCPLSHHRGFHKSVTYAHEHKRARGAVHGWDTCKEVVRIDHDRGHDRSGSIYFRYTGLG